ncbi:MAG: glucose-1-phosphate cytidylyltransferase [Myxococcales bacterium]|nr:glucose-1-phosphate cytidylyltransferase [Myxococcales bacterium]MDD9966771.1 glucose-1-phosphate cytidylyltransferase [Myxococcales bacterium]
MKAVILAGGFGTRLSEETGVKPKPMVEIGGKPILWHIMKIYLHHGVDEMIICGGYKSYVIKEYFANYALYNCDITFDMRKHETIVHNQRAENWRVTLVETGESTLTGGRIKRVRDYIGDETFCLTYGDGVSNVDVTQLIEFHRQQGVEVTLTATKPPGRFGALSLRRDQSKIEHFREKADADGGWVNGGFFVVEPRTIDRIAGDETTWEHQPLESLARDGQLAAFKHAGFWQPMDTLRDKNHLEKLWASGNPPWKVWKD